MNIFMKKMNEAETESDIAGILLDVMKWSICDHFKLIEKEAEPEPIVRKIPKSPRHKLEPFRAP